VDYFTVLIVVTIVVVLETYLDIVLVTPEKVF
jgi:hypothetical protein